jgi:hypothetical protein
MAVLTDFYVAFSPVCFALLSLWLVVVQLNNVAWVTGDQAHHWRGYGVALFFALPGTMSLLALIDAKDPRFWRLSFAVIALGGAVGMIALQAPFWARTGLLAHARFLEPIKSKQPMRRREGAMLVVAVILYVLIGVLAMASRSLLREEAILLIILVFLGFNVAWLLLYDSSAALASNVGTEAAVQPAAVAPGTGKGNSPPFLDKGTHG